MAVLETRRGTIPSGAGVGGPQASGHIDLMREPIIDNETGYEEPLTVYASFTLAVSTTVGIANEVESRVHKLEHLQAPCESRLGLNGLWWCRDFMQSDKQTRSATTITALANLAKMSHLSLVGNVLTTFRLQTQTATSIRSTFRKTCG